MGRLILLYVDPIFDSLFQIADLSIIESRVNRSEYSCLAEFLGDMTRILENCRYFNPAGTRVAAAAEGLEQWLARQIPGVRDKVAMQAK